MRGRIRLRWPSPAIVIAMLALMVAMSGTAVGQAVLRDAKGLITGRDVKNGSVTGKDVKDASLRGQDIADGSLTGRELGSGAVDDAAVADDSLTGDDVKDRSLTLSDLGAGSDQTSTTTAPISIPAGQCTAQLTGNFGDGVIGDLVIGTLTDANGAAVLPNSAAFVPSVVSSSSQGGAVPNLIVCNTDGAAVTIPTGSVFHWRLIGV